jgi:hypothetical protein
MGPNERLRGWANPASRYRPSVQRIDEMVFEVIDANCAKRSLVEIENFMALRRSIARNQIVLFVTIEVNLVGPIPDFVLVF